jgi:hypothetical protein
MPKQLATLNSCPLFPEGDDVEVWYSKTEYFGPFNLGEYAEFDPQDLSKTHILLGTTDRPKDEKNRESLSRLFIDLQGENWSPNGEANFLIRRLGLSHTSMSVGDVIRFKTGEVYFCKPISWSQY